MVKLATGPRRPNKRRFKQRSRPLRRPGTYKRQGLTRHYEARARGQLRKFKQGPILAVAITGFLLMFWDLSFSLAQEKDVSTTESVNQAKKTILDLWSAWQAFWPKFLIALVVMVIGWSLARMMRWTARKVLGEGQRGTSVVALGQLMLFLITVVASLSILVGDVRALLGSLGLIGLALSWALQAPIESFTGWVINSFRSYYRVGDRIEVGEVSGDVYKIDFLTTTVWEIGGPGKYVTAAQPTGAMVTFPNSEVLRANILNYSKDFAFVWDEITVGLTNESDLSYALTILKDAAQKVVGGHMADNIKKYKKLLQRAGLDHHVADVPEVYLSLADFWTNCTIRYLVAVGSRRKWKSLLTEEIGQELNSPKHIGKLASAYLRNEVYLHEMTPSP